MAAEGEVEAVVAALCACLREKSAAVAQMTMLRMHAVENLELMLRGAPPVLWVHLTKRHLCRLLCHLRKACVMMGLLKHLDQRAWKAMMKAIWGSPGAAIVDQIASQRRVRETTIGVIIMISYPESLMDLVKILEDHAPNCSGLARAVGSADDNDLLNRAEVLVASLYGPQSVDRVVPLSLTIASSDMTRNLATLARLVTRADNSRPQVAGGSFAVKHVSIHRQSPISPSPIVSQQKLVYLKLLAQLGVAVEELPALPASLTLMQMMETVQAFMMRSNDSQFLGVRSAGFMMVTRR